MRNLLSPVFLGLLAVVSLDASVINVPAGANLQSSLDAALPGDEIVLQAGATYVGPFTLGAKSGAGEIVIRSSSASDLTTGVRVTPAQSASMPKLTSSSDVVVQFSPGSHDYRLIGLEIAPAAGRFVNDAIRIGSGQERAVGDQPRNIAIERCYVHGDSRAGSRRGIAMNGVGNTVLDSYFENFKATDVDAQAIAGWNGAGPYTIRNNYLEASGENILFGGADPFVEGLVPSNIRIEGNHLSKPASWKTSDSSYEGTHWMVKNLLELKNAKQVVIDRNILENSWRDAQAGYAVVITPRNQDGHSSWSTVEDVQFTNNVIRNAAHGMLVLGHDSPNPSRQTQRLSIRGNTFEKIGGALFEFIDASRDVVIDSNRGVEAAMVISASGEATSGLVFRNNVTVRDEAGILGFPRALSTYFPGAVVEANTFIGGIATNYPANNFFSSQVVRSAPQVIAEVENPGIRVGYAVVTPDSGSNAPIASALVGRVQNAIVLSQTTVFAPAPTTAAAMFVDVVPAIARNMGLAIANPQPVRVSVGLRLTDESGTSIGNPRTISLEPHAQIARFVSELIEMMPSSFTGTLVIEASAPVAMMGFRFSGANFSVISIDSLAGSSALPGGAAMMFPQFATGEGWATQLMMLNRGAASMSGRVDMFDTAGNPMTVTLNGVTSFTFRYTIPAGGTLLLAPRDRNGQSPL